MTRLGLFVRMLEVTRRLTHQEHVEAVKSVHGDTLAVIGCYVSGSEKLDYRCPVHGVFQAKPQNVVHRRSGCRKCYNEATSSRCRKSEEVYQKELSCLGIQNLEPYVTALTKILHCCSVGHVWETTPNQILSGYLCPLCDKSQYKRRPFRLGNRTVWIQGVEGKALDCVQSEGVLAEDIAKTKAEGLPLFRYTFDGRSNRVYVPDFFVKSQNLVVEVKSDVTLGIYSDNIFSQVQAKTRAVLAAGYNFRIIVIYRGRPIEIGTDWISSSWDEFVQEFRRITHAQDRRNSAGRNRCPITGRYCNAASPLL